MHYSAIDQVLFEHQQYLENNYGESSDESDEEIPCVKLKEAKQGLETAIRYIEQSDGVGIDFSDLHIFHKYLNLLSLKELESKCQQL